MTSDDKREPCEPQRLYLLFLANPGLTSHTSCTVLVIQRILHYVAKYCSMKYVFFHVISRVSPASSRISIHFICSFIHSNEGTLSSIEGFVFLAPMKESLARRIRMRLQGHDGFKKKRLK